MLWPAPGRPQGIPRAAPGDAEAAQATSGRRSGDGMHRRDDDPRCGPVLEQRARAAVQQLAKTALTLVVCTGRGHRLGLVSDRLTGPERGPAHGGELTDNPAGRSSVVQSAVV